MELMQPFETIGRPYVLTIGKFDGFHRGHRAIIDQMHEYAACEKVAYLFVPGEQSVLMPVQERLDALCAAGVERTAIARRGDAIWQMEPQAFVEALRGAGSLRAVVVGEGFRFGKGAAGDVVLLSKLGAQHGFATQVVAPVVEQGQAVSSSAIRSALAQGDVQAAQKLLGRRYAVYGQVVPGVQRGRDMGFPTANLKPPEGKLLPMQGVYATAVTIEGGRYPAMTNIGDNPTFNCGKTTVETHVIGAQGDWYEKCMAVEFIARLRGEMRFPSADALKEQLKLDAQNALQMYKK